MKSYRMSVADNGSNWYVSGAPDPRWNNDKLVFEPSYSKVLAFKSGVSANSTALDGLLMLERHRSPFKLGYYIAVLYI